MTDTIHIIGNGPSAANYVQGVEGPKLSCNIPPFDIDGLFATCMVDFKMMNAINNDGIMPPVPWVLGYRPKVYMQKNPSFHMKTARYTREFFTTLPEYATGYTEFNCGHMATAYGLFKFEPKTVHMYGFDSMFNFDLSSATDFYLESDRSEQNNARLTNNWRSIWEKLFAHHPDVTFVLHMDGHDNLKFQKGKNVEIKVY